MSESRWSHFCQAHTQNKKIQLGGHKGGDLVHVCLMTELLTRLPQHQLVPRPHSLTQEMHGHLPSSWSPAWLILGANIIASKSRQYPRFILRHLPCITLLEDAHHSQWPACSHGNTLVFPDNHHHPLESLSDCYRLTSLTSICTELLLLYKLGPLSRGLLPRLWSGILTNPVQWSVGQLHWLHLGP